MLLALILACTSPSIEARLSSIEAQHAADRERVAALEAKLAKLDQFILVMESMGPILVAPGEVGAPVAGAVPTNAGPPPAQGTQPGARTDEACRLEGETYVLPPREVMSLEALANAARLVPHLDTTDAVDGFRLVGVRPDSVLPSCGIQNGDIVLSVSGATMSSPEQARSAFEAAHKASGFTTVLDRAGQRIELKFRWAK